MTEEIRFIDASEQNDELQALESIYPDEFTIIDHDQRWAAFLLDIFDLVAIKFQ